MCLRSVLVNAVALQICKKYQQFCGLHIAATILSILPTELYKVRKGMNHSR